VIVGATAVELRDFFQVPAHGIISGALLQAVAGETLRPGRALAATGLPVTAFGAELMALVLLAIHCRLRLRGALIALAGLSLAVEALAVLVQARMAVVVDTAAWQLLLAGGAVGAVASDLDLKRFWLAVVRAQGRNTQTLLDQVVLDSFDGVVVIDDRGSVQAASRAAGAILAPSSGDWHGRPMGEVLPPVLQKEVAGRLRGGQAAAEAGIREAAVRIGTVERIIEYTITPSTLTGGIGQDPGAARTVACLTFRDITERRHAERRLAYLARFDPLTGLMNRTAFSDRLAEIAKSGQPCTVLYFDLDRFKLVNDTMGHAIGDQVLQEVAARCQALFPHPVLLARFGGDEFAAAWPEAVSGETLSERAERLVRYLSEPYLISGYRLSVGASVGISDLDTAGRDVVRLMSHADAALYRAKRSGGGRHSFFDETMATQLHARQRLELDLKDAIAGDQFEAAYQPQIDLRSGRITGVEALLRWKHPDRGYVSPAEFIPVAEEIGAIEALGEWVLRRACRDVAAWPGECKLAVNISPLQFLRGELVAAVRSALAESGLPASRLDLEITESLFIHDDQHVKNHMEALRRDGIGFALDDFGTGYSSLSYVRRFPFDKIKVDRSFVSGLPHDPDAVAIIQAIVAMASNLGIRINAEGIETPEQTTFLRLLGCDEGQGFGLGRPKGADAIAALLEAEAQSGPLHAPAAAPQLDVTDVTA
jgi:diguanylate cyclase (GGDEF)-like protein